MKNLLLLLLLFTIACTSVPVQTPEGTPISKVEEVSFVKVTKFTGFTEEEIEKAHKYIPVMNSTIASKCFEDFMLERELIQTNDKSRSQVIQDLRTNQVSIELIMYYKRFRKVAGYTEQGADWIRQIGRAHV